MTPLRIGVLGGIGPEATGMFYLKLIRRLQEEKLIKSNADFPQIVVNSIPAPELIFAPTQNPDLSRYIQGLQELDSLGPDFVVMVCNTIHLHHGELQSMMTARLIDLREEVRKEIAGRGIKSISIIGTPSTITGGLYAFAGVRCCNPSEEEMSELSDAILNFNNGADKETQKTRVEVIAKRCLAKGSELAVLACTEFAVMLEDADIPKLNTIDVLVGCVIEEFKASKQGKSACKHQNIDK